MALVNGKSYGSSSVTRSLARHRLAEGAGEKSKEAERKVVSTSDKAIDAATSEHDHAGEDASHDVIKGVVAEHGPSNKAEVKADGEFHSVHTTHEDGHKHTSHGHPHLPHVAEHLAHAAGAEGDAQSDELNEEDKADGQPSAGPLSFMGNLNGDDE